VELKIKYMTIRQGLVTLIMGIAIVVLLIFPKGCGVDKLEDKINWYKANIHVKEVEADELRAKAGKLEKKLKDDSLKHLELERKFTKQITLLEQKVAAKRKISQPIIDRNDTIKQLIHAIDSAYALQAARINELKDENRIQGLVCRDLTDLHTQRFAVINEINLEREMIIIDQERVIRKLKRGRVLRNILIPVTAVGVFLLTVQ
jgi:hypothetical protein